MELTPKLVEFVPGIGVKEPARGRMKAEQLRGIPYNPVQALYPIAQNPSQWNTWILGNTGLSEGVVIRTDATISFAPAMISRMRIRILAVVVDVDGWGGDCEYTVSLIYRPREGNDTVREAPRVWASKTNQCSFRIPLENISITGYFVCAIQIKLHTPIPHSSPEYLLALQEGQEQPMCPVIIKGAYMWIEG